MAGLISGRKISTGRLDSGFGGSTTTEIIGPVKPDEPVGEVLRIPTVKWSEYTIEFETINSGTIEGSDIAVYIQGHSGATAISVDQIIFRVEASNHFAGIHYEGRWLLSPWDTNDRALQPCPMFSAPIESYVIRSSYSVSTLQGYTPEEVHIAYDGKMMKTSGNSAVYKLSNCDLDLTEESRIKIASIHINYTQSAVYGLSAGGTATIPYKKFCYTIGSNVVSYTGGIYDESVAHMVTPLGDVERFSKCQYCSVRYDTFNGDLQAEYDFCHQWYGKFIPGYFAKGTTTAQTSEQSSGTPDSTLTVTATATSDTATTIKFTYGPRTYTVPINEGQTQIQFIIDTSGADGSYALRYSVEDGEANCELSNIIITTQGSETVFVQPEFNRRTDDQLSLVDTAIISISSNETPDAEDELNLVDNTEFTVIAPPPAPVCSDELDLVDDADITIIPPPPVPDYSDELSLADEASIIITSPPNPDAVVDNISLQDNAVLTV